MDEILRMTLLASTDEGYKTGLNLGPNYRGVLARWEWRLRPTQRVSAKMRAEFVRDLRQALEADLVSALLENTAAKWVNAGVKLPSFQTLERYATIAARRALGPDANDLLDRFQDASSGTGAVDRLPSSEYLLPSRAARAVSQITDQASGHFNQEIAKWAEQDGLLTGRQRWLTNSAASRHANLNGQIAPLGGTFNDRGNRIFGPLPRGGHPNHWSGCSCRIQFERTDGSWFTP